MMLIPAAQFRRRRGRVKAKQPTPPPVPPLVLVSASYDPGGPWATLVFDRAVDISGFNAATLHVNDPVTFHGTMDGAEATLVDAVTVLCYVANDSPDVGGGITLTVDGGNGIVAVDDGGLWSGVIELALPFP